MSVDLAEELCSRSDDCDGVRISRFSGERERRAGWTNARGAITSGNNYRLARPRDAVATFSAPWDSETRNVEGSAPFAVRDSERKKKKKRVDGEKERRGRKESARDARFLNETRYIRNRHDD